MEKYIGTKIVEAEPATRGELEEYLKNLGPRACQAPDPNEEGYIVKYPDGYISWSPADVFEKAYHKASGMNFGEAIVAMKVGAKVARKGWNGKGQYIELASNISYKNPESEIINAEHAAIGNKAIAFVGTSGVQLGWLASQADMLADDWTSVS